MSALKQRLARIGASAGVLAVTTAAIFAVGGASASSALAVEHCKGSSINGEGSSLQGTSQKIWTAGASPKGFNHNAAGCTAAGAPTATYLVSSSGTALKAWGAANKMFNTTGDNYLGSDDGPTKTQIENINTGLGTKATSKISVVPVTQTAIALLANPPANCTITQLTNANLEKAFRQETKVPTWKEIGGSGTGCEVGVKRVVRLDSSGTSYHLKHYLFEINPAKVKCLVNLSPTEQTWKEIQNSTESFTVGGAETTKNQQWPECTFGTTKDAVVRPTATGGGAVVKTVGETDASIGYAALPDAEGSNLKTETTNIPSLEDGEEAGEVTFASPLAAGKTANCTGVAYTKPRNLAGTQVEFNSTENNLDWSEVYGTNPKVGGGKYPICTLTYDIAAVNSTGVFGAILGETAKGEKVAQTVKDFLGYVIAGTGGQADIKENYYAALPTGPATAATKAVEAIH